MNRNAVWIAAGLLFSTTFVVSSPASAAKCEEEYAYHVEEVGSPEYATTAPATGQRNDSTETSDLSYTMRTTTSRATNWAIDGGGEVGWGIFKVESHTKWDVTNQVEKGVEIGTRLSVPGKHFGYVQPKVEIRKFEITKGRIGWDCKWHEVKNYGVLAAITGWPFFSTCVEQGPCLPKP